MARKASGFLKAKLKRRYKFEEYMDDLKFLREIKENIILGLSDITKHEMALTMIQDWIDELEDKTKN